MIVADTSALVSLAAVDTIDVVFDEFDVATTAIVIAELEETATYDDGSGFAAQCVLDRRSRVSIFDVTSPDIGSNRIDEGEGSCVTLVGEVNADFLVTDDYRALPELQPLVDAQVAISPIVLKALVKRDQLSGSEARKRLDEMAERRCWLESPIYRNARALFRD